MQSYSQSWTWKSGWNLTLMSDHAISEREHTKSEGWIRRPAMAGYTISQIRGSFQHDFAIFVLDLTVGEILWQFLASLQQF